MGMASLEAKKPMDDLRISGIGVRPGSRVKLRPRAAGMSWTLLLRADCDH